MPIFKVAHPLLHSCSGGFILKVMKPLIMSNQANIELLESIFEEVQEAFPFYDEEKQIEIANNRFWEMAQ